jgi:hypothetical protein
MTKDFARSTSVCWPDGPDFDAAESGHGMARRDLDGLIDTFTFDQIEARDPLLGLGQGTVGDHALPLTHADRHGPVDADQTMPYETDALPVAVGHPLLDIVSGRIAGFGGRISVHTNSK